MTYEIATFAGGCFWCTEADFDKVRGVIRVISGYTGGTVPNPTYEQVCAGGTGHQEAVQITFDRAQIDYNELLDIYWRSIDPTDAEGQFSDRGESYKPVIFVHSNEQRQQAEESRQNLAAYLKKPVAVEIKEASAFYPAEEYHQKYYQKNPGHYQLYRWGSGRPTKS